MNYLIFWVKIHWDHAKIVRYGVIKDISSGVCGLCLYIITRAQYAGGLCVCVRLCICVCVCVCDQKNTPVCVLPLENLH